MKEKDFKKYYETMQFLQNLGKLDSPLQYMRERKPEDLDKYLLRMQELLDNVGNPEKKFKYIHVTGTSGKGTTVAMIHNMLLNAGYNVGSTSSPAATSTIERIKVNDLFIEPEEFTEIVDNIKPAIQKMYLTSTYGKPSYFDIILAIALIYFKKMKCDWVILEVGMGGRYDSTNIIKSPKIMAITNIGLDHTDLLGNTKEEIAFEKAGIIKKGGVLFTTEVTKTILNIFQRICEEQGASYIPVSAKSNQNEQLVCAIGNYLGISSTHIENSLEKTMLPCRFEIVSDSPLVILDGAHNVSKVAFALKKLTRLKNREITLIFGAGEKKDAIGMLEILVPFCSKVILTPVTTSRNKSFSIKEMIKHLNYKHRKVEIMVTLDNERAIEMALKIKSRMILVIGSFYLAGNIRKKWYPESYILENRKVN